MGYCVTMQDGTIKELLRCSGCRKLLWENSSPKIIAKHIGHGQIRSAITLSPWENLKVRLGWVR